MIQPPTTGPTVGASTAMMPAIVPQPDASGRKQQEDAGEHRRDQRAAGKSLHDAEDDERREVAR